MASVVALILTIHMIYELCFVDSSQWIAEKYRNLTIIISVLFTLTSIMDGIHITVKYYVFPNNYPVKNELVITTLADLFYFIGDIMFYILILLRIYVPFNVNIYVIYFLSFLITVSGVSFLLYLVGIYEVFDDVDYFWPMIDSISTLNDLALNVTILSIFTIKLKQMIAEIDASLSLQAEKNVNLVSHVIVKHCLLFGVAMIINQLFFTWNTYEVLASLEIYIWHLYVGYSIRAIENVTNVLVLWLVLRVNYDKYILCCGRCHKCVGKCCFKNTDAGSIDDNPYFELRGVTESNDPNGP